jgi:AraC-like DNA-binding protein
MEEIQRASVLPFDLPLPRNPRLHRVTPAILASLNDRRTLTDWSTEAGASEGTLNRLFVRKTGLTFAQWRQQARLIDACVSLSMGAKPAATASAAGYASQPAFGAAFRAFFGCTSGAIKGRVGVGGFAELERLNRGSTGMNGSASHPTQHRQCPLSGQLEPGSKIRKAS